MVRSLRVLPISADFNVILGQRAACPDSSPELLLSSPVYLSDEQNLAAEKLKVAVGILVNEIADSARLTERLLVRDENLMKHVDVKFNKLDLLVVLNALASNVTDCQEKAALISEITFGLGSLIIDPELPIFKIYEQLKRELGLA